MWTAGAQPVMPAAGGQPVVPAAGGFLPESSPPIGAAKVLMRLALRLAAGATTPR